MSLDFNKHAQKGNLFLRELAEELGDPEDLARAGRVMRAVFKALRNHLTLAENFQLISQLPMALKGIYVDAWMPTHEVEASRKKIDFIEEVLRFENKKNWMRVEDADQTEQSIRAVFKTLKKYISQGEFEDLQAVLPRQLKAFLKESLYTKRMTVDIVKKEGVHD